MEVDRKGRKSVVGAVIAENPLAGSSPSMVSSPNTHKQLFSQPSYSDFANEEDAMSVFGFGLPEVGGFGITLNSGGFTCCVRLVGCSVGSDGVSELVGGDGMVAEMKVGVLEKPAAPRLGPLAGEMVFEMGDIGVDPSSGGLSCCDRQVGCSVGYVADSELWVVVG